MMDCVTPVLSAFSNRQPDYHSIIIYGTSVALIFEINLRHTFFDAVVAAVIVDLNQNKHDFYLLVYGCTQFTHALTRVTLECLSF